MKRLRWFVMALLAVAALPAGALAQAGIVAGRVVEENNGRALSGAQITLVGTSRRTVTDQEGRYRMEGVPSGRAQVRASRIGYDSETQTVQVGAGQTVTADFQLGTSAVAIDALVVNAVTGQTEQVKEIGNSVGTINAEDINLATITKPADVLQGRVAGVQVQSVSGTTGTGQKIRIRGANSLSLSNEPLVIVDGIRYENSTTLGSASQEGGIDQDPNRLNDISPEDIASMEVLRGPAASGIYGTAAANGVIVITTKQGRAGRPRWNFAVEAGKLDEVTEYPANYVALQRNANGSFSGCRTIRAVVGVCRQDTLAVFNPLEDGRTSPFQEGFRRKYALSVSGGGDRATYYVSSDWENESGVYANNDLEKINLRTNLRALISDKLTLTANAGYTTSDVSFPSNDNSIISPILNGLLGGALFDDENPGDIYYGFSPEQSEKYQPKQDIERFTGSLNANYNPLSWLSANMTAGLDFTNAFDHQVLQPGDIPLGSPWDEGWVEEFRWNNYNYTLNGALNAKFDLADWLRSTSTAGIDYNQARFARTYAFGAGVIPGTGSLNATSSQFRAGETNTNVVTLGGFVQQQFAIRDRIFLTGALRADDNSAFGEDFGLVTYPSANISWLVSDEDFFPDLSFLSSFRLRAAYGKSGLRPNFRDAVTFYSPDAVETENGDVPAITIGGTGNLGLEPERTSEFETGFDLGLADDRIGLQLTYFNKKSNDALILRDLPPSAGLFTNRYENIGAIRNKGVEVSVDARVIDTRPFGLNLRVSGSTLDNEILDMGGVPPIILNRGVQEHREGQSAGAFYAPKVTYSDANGDGIIAREELDVDAAGGNLYIGPSIPTFTGSLSGEVSIFDFLKVSSLFDTRRGHYTINDNERFRCQVVAFGDRGCRGAWDASAPLEQQAAYIAGLVGDPGNAISKELFIEKADFVKWRELAFTLTPPQRWVSRLGRVDGLSFTIAGRNLKTWTDYTGLDPEANETGSNSNFTQGEFGSQAPVRYWTARINFNF